VVFSRHPHLVLLAFLAIVTTVLSLWLSRHPPEAAIAIRTCQWGEPWQQEVAQQIATAFEKRYAAEHWKVKCEFYGVSRTYWTKLKTMIPAGVEPEVMMMGADYIPDWVRRGKTGVLLSLSDVDALLDKHLPNRQRTGRITIHEDEYYQSNFDAFRYQKPGEQEKKLYGMPFQFGTVALFYNKRLFDRAGVKYPDETWTWKEYREVAKALTRDLDGDNVTDVWGTNIVAHPERGYGSFIWSNGGQIIDRDLGRITLADQTPGPDGRSNFDRVTEALFKHTGDIIEVRSITQPLGKIDPIIHEYITRVT
jgi:multiple sugar transport system substrate-binding protein